MLQSSLIIALRASAFARMVIVAASLLFLAAPAVSLIGFKIGGVCLAACGSDSLLNRAASSIGSAFTDGSVRKFGDEGRRIVDYADARAQERLKELSSLLESQRGLAIRDIAAQRQLFANNLTAIVSTAASDLRNIVTSAIRELEQTLQDALDKLDSSLRSNVGSIGVMFSAAGGLLSALTIVLIYSFHKIAHRAKFNSYEILVCIILVICLPVATMGFAVWYNNYKESQLADIWERQMNAALSDHQIAKAAAIARRINLQWPNPVRDYSDRKLSATRDFLLGGDVWDTDALRSRTAGVQAASRNNKSSRLDADVMIILAYLYNKANDSLTMNDIIQKFLGNALLEPRTGNLGPYENELRLLGCDLYRTIEVANTKTSAHPALAVWIKESSAVKRDVDYISVSAKEFGVTRQYAENVIGRERPAVPDCVIADNDFRVDADRLADGATASDLSSMLEIAVLQRSLQVRRQVLLMDATAGLWLSQCFFDDQCPHPEEIEKRFSRLNEVIHSYFSRGVAIAPPARAIAVLQFTNWLWRNRVQSDDWLDRNHKPVFPPRILISDPAAPPITKCFRHWPPGMPFTYHLKCEEIRVSSSLGQKHLEEIAASVNSYLLRLIERNVKNFANVRTGSVLSAIYELSYRNALVDTVLAYNDAASLGLIGIRNSKTIFLQWPPTPPILSNSDLVDKKPDSPLWSLVTCKEPQVEDRRYYWNINRCDEPIQLRTVFDIFESKERRSKPPAVISDRLAAKLNTAFAF